MAATMNQVQTFKGGDSMFTKDQVRQLISDMDKIHAEHEEMRKAWQLEQVREWQELEQELLNTFKQDLAQETNENMRQLLHRKIERVEGRLEMLDAFIDLLEGNLVAEEDV